MSDLDLFDLTRVARATTVTSMTTTTYPLTPYRWPNVGDDVDYPMRFVGAIGESDFGQVQHVLTHEMLNDPKHFHTAFPMWTTMARDIASDDDDTSEAAWEVFWTIQPDVEAWLADYEGIEWDGGEPMRPF